MVVPRLESLLHSTEELESSCATAGWGWAGGTRGTGGSHNFRHQHQEHGKAEKESSAAPWIFHVGIYHTYYKISLLTPLQSWMHRLPVGICGTRQPERLLEVRKIQHPYKLVRAINTSILSKDHICQLIHICKQFFKWKDIFIAGIQPKSRIKGVY